MNDRNSDITTVIAAFILGGLVGAVVAILMAPQSGQETRSLIRDKSVELKDKAVGTAEDLANQTKSRVSEIKQQGEEMIEKQKGRVESQVESAKKSMSY
jgi:gas vesicle protein